MGAQTPLHWAIGTSQRAIYRLHDTFFSFTLQSRACGH
ncbi:hypothetical protein CEV31_0005 [Brucella thiophenivorans]|uniref:Uncharacterized protein n=1 Tax=Brucella thiophenivorans TaxID=571255 RepID=A0A256G8M6_9HYPH|nr:hypothetical protein CEV31_0005 [Brucella thiophenivorans]